MSLHSACLPKTPTAPCFAQGTRLQEPPSFVGISFAPAAETGDLRMRQHPGAPMVALMEPETIQQYPGTPVQGSGSSGAATGAFLKGILNMVDMCVQSSQRRNMVCRSSRGRACAVSSQPSTHDARSKVA